MRFPKNGSESSEMGHPLEEAVQRKRGRIREELFPGMPHWRLWSFHGRERIQETEMQTDVRGKSEREAWLDWVEGGGGEECTEFREDGFLEESFRAAVQGRMTEE